MKGSGVIGEDSVSINYNNFNKQAVVDIFYNRRLSNKYLYLVFLC